MDTHSAIYLDHAASTSVHPEVLESMRPWLSNQTGNPTALHRPGRNARRAIDHAREQVAAFIHVEPREILFTSGGTEANNLALRGLLPPGSRLLTTTIEHHSILHTAEALRKHNGIEITLSPATANGIIADTTELLTNNTTLVSVMHANNETGVIQPIEPIAAVCRDRGILFHTDAIQSAAHLPVEVGNLPIDLLSLSGHKLGAPPGIGALYCRHGLALTPQLTGGTQERARRAGTENFLGIIALGATCELTAREQDKETTRLTKLRNQFEQAILDSIPSAEVNCTNAPRLPHIANIRFPGHEGENIMMSLDAAGIAVTTGSACTSGSVDPSHVLLAMGQDHPTAHSAVRFSFGSRNTESDIEPVVRTLEGVINRS